MKRILFVVESSFPLGPIQQLYQLANQLAARSYEIHIAVLYPGATDECDGFSSQVQVHYCKGDGPGLPLSRATWKSIDQLRSLTDSLQPDVLHSWCGMSGFVTLAATQFRSKTLRKPVRRFATELALQAKKGITRQLFEHNFRHGFEKIAVPHEAAKKHLIDNGYDSQQIKVIPNSIESSTPDRAACRDSILNKLNLPGTAKIAGTVAALSPRTRLKDLIWASDLLTCIRDDFHFLILGTGNQEARLKRFASLTESETHIHFLGEPADARQTLAGLDFYWHSHLLEPLPVNLLNAMSIGIPAISVYGPGTTEIIRHQETGFAVNFGARDEFARWTKYLIELSQPANKLAQQGQAFVQRNFCNQSLAEQYLQFYA